MNKNGPVSGAVSGGCIEADIFFKSRHLFKSKSQEIISIQTGSEEDDIFGSGTGCEGSLTILAEYLPQDLSSNKLATYIGPRNHAEAKGPYICIDQTEGRFRRNFRNSVHKSDLYSYRVSPPPEVILFGSEGAVPALYEQFFNLGYSLSIVSHKARPDSFKRAQVIVGSSQTIDFHLLPKNAYVVVASHSLAEDSWTLAHIQKTCPKYVGLIGSSTRQQKLERFGVNFQLLQQLTHFDSPAGGKGSVSYTPEDVAFNITLKVQKMVSSSKRLLRKDVAGVILAAGRSARFHGVKQQAVMDEISLLKRAATQLARLPLTKKIILIREDIMSWAHEELAPLGEITLIPIEKNAGMGVTLAKAASQCLESSGLLVMLCDQPFIPAAHYDALIERYLSTNASTATLTSKHVAPAIIEKKSFGDLLKLSADHGARELLANAEAVACKEAAYDIDTKSSFYEFTNKFQTQIPSDGRAN
jgi:CTP:molybdopterin cytidylyltransferase MocA/xanthine/CO dehydrogenase XdhC/CoxF family maturation factor